VLLALFVASLGGQLLAGHAHYDAERRQRGAPPMSLGEYAISGHFVEAVGENWESEFLQMLAFIMLTVFLFQAGSPESNDPERVETKASASGRRNASVPWPVRRGGFWLAVYQNSLGLAFLALFATSFALHVVGGRDLWNEERALDGFPPVSYVDYVVSSRFWYESFQNWQSEFLSVAAMVYLSVYLRQRGSAESKPVDAPHDAHE
jgi:hypothetical protein